ncbi:hypothetical protein PRVXH_002338 [Proteinivorax hydrogeniformans]|uniref:Uncharacterized protein n=1 Tax=Proteinivorax hydrogeniformans TaxID=1826727 RepID=A0AAU8HS61_9FIRM
MNRLFKTSKILGEILVWTTLMFLMILVEAKVLHIAVWVAIAIYYYCYTSYQCNVYISDQKMWERENFPKLILSVAVAICCAIFLNLLISEFVYSIPMLSVLVRKSVYLFLAILVIPLLILYIIIQKVLYKRLELFSIKDAIVYSLIAILLVSLFASYKGGVETRQDAARVNLSYLRNWEREIYWTNYYLKRVSQNWEEFDTVEIKEKINNARKHKQFAATLRESLDNYYRVFENNNQEYLPLFGSEHYTVFMVYGTKFIRAQEAIEDGDLDKAKKIVKWLKRSYNHIYDIAESRESNAEITYQHFMDVIKAYSKYDIDHRLIR